MPVTEWTETRIFTLPSGNTGNETIQQRPAAKEGLCVQTDGSSQVADPVAKTVGETKSDAHVNYHQTIWCSMRLLSEFSILKNKAELDHI